jgi:dTMP kinase
MGSGKYIVLEGIDGSGKTTQAKRLQLKLISEGHHVYLTTEPTDGPVGKLIRKILSGELEIDKRIMSMLFVPDTLDHFIKDNGILSMLNEDTTVIADRSYFSTLAYQSVYLPLDWLIQAHSISMNLRKPDLVIFLDADPKICFQRLIDRGTSLQIHEKLNFLEGVRERYYEVFARTWGGIPIKAVSGVDPKEQVFDEIWKLVSKVI